MEEGAEQGIGVCCEVASPSDVEATAMSLINITAYKHEQNKGTDRCARVEGETLGNPSRT